MDPQKGLRILHVIDSGGLYGAENMLLNLVTEQAHLGMKPIIASIGDRSCSEKPLETEARRRGLRIEVFRMRPGLNIAGALRILRFARHAGCDIIHSHGYKGNILLGFMPKSLRRIPIVSTLHGWTWTGGWNRMRLYEWLDRLSLRFIDRVVGVNTAMRKRINLENFRIINNGIPTTGSTLKPNASLDPQIVDFCNGGYTLGAIGRFSPEKGFDVLLKAVHEASKTHPEIRLVIIGEGFKRSALESNIKELGIKERVLMPGYVRNAKDYLPFFKIFVISSHTEGLPIVLLEAMFAGTPIVSTDVGGIPEVLDSGSAGTLVRAGDVKGLSEAILSVYRAPATADEKSLAAKEILKSRYSAKTMALAYRDAYAEILV